MPTTNNIRVLSIRLINDNRPLKAFVEVQLDDWVIRDFRIIQQNGQRVYVASPQNSWKDPESGLIKYKSVLTIPPVEKQRIETEILHAYHKEKEKLNAREENF